MIMEVRYIINIFREEKRFPLKPDTIFSYAKKEEAIEIARIIFKLEKPFCIQVEREINLDGNYREFEVKRILTLCSDKNRKEVIRVDGEDVLWLRKADYTFHPEFDKYLKDQFQLSIQLNGKIVNARIDMPTIEKLIQQSRFEIERKRTLFHVKS